MPDWRERHVPDLGITLVELLAYVGDYLSYYQDAVATEAYLDTARQRISVRRHARLVDYQHARGLQRARLGDASTTADGPRSDAGRGASTSSPALPGSRPRAAASCSTRIWIACPRTAYEVFEPLVARPDSPLALLRGPQPHPLLHLGRRECCLPRGATRATLLDDGVAHAPDQKPPNYPAGLPAPN